MTQLGAGRCRIVSSAIFLFISYFHPLTVAESSPPSGVPVYPCAQSGRRGCSVETERSRLSGGKIHVREKRSSNAVDDPVREYPDGPKGLFRPGNIHGRMDHPDGNKFVWNVPFRMMYRNEKKGFKFGKRFSSDLGNDLGKRPAGSGDRAQIKSERRRKNTDSGIIGPEETVPDAEHKKSVVFVGTKNPKGNSEIGSKRKFKFGKKSDPGEQEEKDDGEIQDVEKRRILFGKRSSRFYGVDEPLEDFPDPVEAKRRRKFHFG